MVQRLLSARSLSEGRKALFASWIVICFQFTLFLFIGLLLFVFYTDSGLAAPKPADRIYPDFIWRYLPPGVAGLVIAAILAAAMSNLSAALNSLASTTIMDFYKPMMLARSKERSEAHFLSMAKWATIVWGVVLFLIGLVARHWGSVLEAGLSIASIIYGSLLGVFILGLATKHVGERSASFGMVVGLVLMLFVKFNTTIAWTWYVLIGTSVTLCAALLASLIMPEARKDV
jgi:Na+/proline symporter